MKNAIQLLGILGARSTSQFSRDMSRFRNPREERIHKLSLDSWSEAFQKLLLKHESCHSLSGLPTKEASFACSPLPLAFPPWGVLGEVGGQRCKEGRVSDRLTLSWISLAWLNSDLALKQEVSTYSRRWAASTVCCHGRLQLLQQPWVKSGIPTPLEHCCCDPIPSDWDLRHLHHHSLELGLEWIWFLRWVAERSWLLCHVPRLGVLVRSDCHWPQLLFLSNISTSVASWTQQTS